MTNSIGRLKCKQTVSHRAWGYGLRRQQAILNCNLRNPKRRSFPGRLRSLLLDVLSAKASSALGTHDGVSSPCDRNGSASRGNDLRPLERYGKTPVPRGSSSSFVVIEIYVELGRNKARIAACGAFRQQNRSGGVVVTHLIAQESFAAPLVAGPLMCTGSSILSAGSPTSAPNASSLHASG
jgi:hypothetical protein